MPRHKKQKTHKVVVQIENPFGDFCTSEMCRGVLRYAKEHPTLEVIVNSWWISLTHPSLTLAEIVQEGIEAVLFFDETFDPAELAEMTRQNIRFLQMGKADYPQLLSVQPDNREAGRMAAHYLMERGFRSFGFVGRECLDNQKPFVPGEERQQSFMETLRQHGFACSLLQYPLTFEQNPQLDLLSAKKLAQWLRGLPQPVAILTMNDLRGLHTMEACKLLGYRVPNQVAIVGMENIKMMCEFGAPSLSTVDLNLIRTGYEAAAWMERILNGECPSENIMYIPPQGVVTRVSSDMLAVEDPVVMKAVTYIQDHLAEGISIGDVSKFAGVHNNTLLKHIQSAMPHKTIHDIILDFRLAKVQRLLQDTHLSMQEIAEQSGFRRSTYLARVFKSKFNISPSDWREKYS